MLPIVSIIIPCYNSGAFLGEALDSVKSYAGKHLYEIIIIDDGSTDEGTLHLLNLLQKDGITVIHQENKGPAGARNTGTRSAQADYILFLDSDNKIRDAYIEKGVEVLRSNPDVGIVYGDLYLFGQSSKPRLVPEFDMHRLLAGNFIDMCAMIRKKVWDDISGFDEDRRVIGFEDWDFWIRASEAGWKFHHVNEILFDYRVRPNSLLQQARRPERYHEMLNYVHSKHLELFIKNYKSLFQQYSYYKHDQEKPLRSFWKFFYRKYIFKKHSG